MAQSSQSAAVLLEKLTCPYSAENRAQLSGNRMKSQQVTQIQLISVKVSLFTGEFWHFLLIYYEYFFRGSIHQGHEAFSEHSSGRQCAFMSLAALVFNRSNSVDLWTQTNIDDILCHGDRMYLHALTNKNNGTRCQ